MLSWDQIVAGAGGHFAGATSVAPGLRFTVDHAPDGVQAIAARPAHFIGLDVLVLLAHVAPLDELSVFVAARANQELDGASLTLFGGHYALRLVLPLAMLDWRVLRAATARLARAAEAIRIAARAEAERQGSNHFRHQAPEG